MALFHSPRVVTDGLAFYYDMSNTQKSWKGAPTTNLVNPAWAAWGIDGSGQGSIGTRTITSIYECLISDTAANTRQSIYITGISASTTYTFSVQYKKQFGAPTLRFQLQSYNGGTFLGSVFPTTVQLGLTDKEGWQTAYFSYTTAAGTTRVLWFMQDGDDYTTYTHSFILANPQCEQQSFATPFVAGTRSTTQAIVDLTNNNSITASNLTYASDGTFSFNGASSVINIGPSTRYLPLESHTLEAWVKSPGLGAGMSTSGVFGITYGLIVQILSGGVLGYYAYNTDSGSAVVLFDVNTSGVNLFDNTWHHIVCTRTSTTASIYIDGVLNATASGGGAWSGTNIWSAMDAYIGYNPNNVYYWANGYIGSAKIYKKALSASEVYQNFNAHRSRYGI